MAFPVAFVQVTMAALGGQSVAQTQPGTSPLSMARVGRGEGITGCGLRARARSLANMFVRVHHELLFVHVAAYSKSFTAASREVWELIDESGLEVIQEDDITASVIRAACLGLSAALAAVIGLSAFPHTGHSWVSFTFICFCLGYVTCALALQTLNSAIMSIYVCFAEHPTSLKVHFPIVHHRFARIAEFSESPGMSPQPIHSP